MRTDIATPASARPTSPSKRVRRSSRRWFVLDIARGDIHDELGERRGIARALGAPYGYIGHGGECGGLRERVKPVQFQVVG
jgi:hypothetical protein